MTQHSNSTANHAHIEDEWETIKGECPVCQREKGWCSQTADGTKVCCRFQSKDAVHSGTDSAGSPFHIHLRGPQEDEARPRRPRSKPVGPAPAPADPDTRDAVYAALLSDLSLSKAHRADLVGRRGFPADEPERRGYRSLPRGDSGGAVARLVERFGADTLPKVPGFYLEQGKVRFSCLPGLLIPVRDHRGRIVALLSRPDGELKGRKYLWVSSKRKGGPGPGCPTHVPLDYAESETCRLTEGALKADLATILSGMPTIGVAGASNWRACLPLLKVSGFRIVRLAFDADASVNPTIVGALLTCARSLKAEGYSIELERWDLADAKGIDDLLAAGKQAEILTGAAAEEAINEVARATGYQVEEAGPNGTILGHSANVTCPR